MDTPNRRGYENRFYSSSHSNRYNGHHHYRPSKRNYRVYFPNYLKKVKSPTFDGDVKKLKYAKVWLIWMKNLFQLHDYAENMNSVIAIFGLNGKLDIRWEDVKGIRDIKE